MSLKIKIKARIKEKFPNVNLSKTRLDKIADTLDSKITEEDEIDAKLDEMDGIFSFAEIAKQDDKIRDLESKVKTPIKKEDDEEEEEEEDPATPKEKKKTDDPVLKLLEEMKAEISAIKTEKAVNTQRSTLEAKLKDAPELERKRILRDFGRMKFETDEEFDEYLEEVDTDVAEIIQSNAEAGAVGPRVSGIGATNLNDIKPASDKELDAVMENFKI